MEDKQIQPEKKGVSSYDGLVVGGVWFGGHGAEAESGISGGNLPCDEPGGRREPIVRERDAADWERFVETLVTVGWIAERLRMGSVANENTLLDHWRRDRQK